MQLFVKSAISKMQFVMEKSSRGPFYMLAPESYFGNGTIWAVIWENRAKQALQDVSVS
jgi:hypothetical protein